MIPPLDEAWILRRSSSDWIVLAIVVKDAQDTQRRHLVILQLHVGQLVIDPAGRTAIGPYLANVVQVSWQLPMALENILVLLYLLFKWFQLLWRCYWVCVLGHATVMTGIVIDACSCICWLQKRGSFLLDDREVFVLHLV